MRATPHGAGFARERPATAGTGPRCLGNLLLLRGDLAEAEVLSEGRRLATDPDDAVVLARALAGEGYLEFRRSHVAEAQADWQEALEIAQHAGDERAAAVLRSLAIAAASSGRQDRAGDLLDRAIDMARRTGDDQQLRLLLGSAAERHLWLGDYQAAEDAYGDALALASAIGDLSARPLLLAELGWASCRAPSSMPNTCRSRRPSSRRISRTAAHGLTLFG